MFSDDGGKTWQPEVLIDNGGIQLDAETDVIELKDGTLYAAQRPHMCFATSKDRGATWTVSQPMGFPGHCPYFLRTKDDVILLAFRVPNTSLRFSRDECKTWSDNVVIDEVGGALSLDGESPGWQRAGGVLRRGPRLQYSGQAVSCDGQRD